MKPLFIFPVKECSTRLPRKNLLKICGKPLFSYSLKAITNASRKYLNSRCIVTTESIEILGIVDALFDPEYIYYQTDLRPEKLAKDPYQMGDVCKYVIEKYSLQDYNPLVVVQCTLPFITADDIINCIEMYKKSNVKSIRVFKEIDKQWENRNHIAFQFNHNIKPVVQSLGGIVVCETSYVLENSCFPNYAVPYILPKERAIDVDDKTDFICAKALMEAAKNESSSIGACH